MNKGVVKDFFDAWGLYDRVLDCNYMFHNEIYQELSRALAHRFGNREITMMDLGCGSARHLAPALKDLHIRHYVGCDISDVALAHAGRNLACLGCPLELYQVDLAEGIAAGDDKFDVVFSSFALHHLTTAGKAGFFEQARRRLAPNGALLLIDVAREENEDRNTYMDAYCGWIKSGWNKLSQSDLDFIFDHIRNNDFPETDAELRRMALNAGFQNGTLHKAELWHHLWEFCMTRV